MNTIELLSPAGDFDSLKAAVQNGADSVYLGGNLFNARHSATNFDNDLLKEAIKYCKLRNVKTNLTLNTLIKNNEFEPALNLAKFAYESGIDAIIVQDLGLAKFLIKNLPDLPIHASTQMTVHNLDGVLALYTGIKNITFLSFLMHKLVWKSKKWYNVKRNPDYIYPFWIFVLKFRRLFK